MLFCRNHYRAIKKRRSPAFKNSWYGHHWPRVQSTIKHCSGIFSPHTGSIQHFLGHVKHAGLDSPVIQPSHAEAGGKDRTISLCTHRSPSRERPAVADGVHCCFVQNTVFPTVVKQSPVPTKSFKQNTKFLNLFLKLPS